MQRDPSVCSSTDVTINGTQTDPLPEVIHATDTRASLCEKPSGCSASLSSSDDTVASANAARGLFLGLLAACSYSIANLALRSLADSDGGLAWDVWVSGVKALPTAVAAGWLITRRWRTGRTVDIPLRLLGPLILAALVMQIGGNVGFQLSLRSIGLAISVPIVFSSIILSGAVVGRTVLGDVVTSRTAVSMALMVASIGFLSFAAHGTPASADAMTETTSAGIETPNATASAIPMISMAKISSPSVNGLQSSGLFSLSVTTGVLIALISGLSYGLCGVVIRRVVRGNLPVESTLMIFSLTGLVALCPTSGMSLGWDGLHKISGSEWWIMLAAGTFNAVGFFSITHAMRLLTITRANVINASQNAMCAAGAVLFFAEPMSPLAMLGIGLTILGLLTLDRR